MVKKKPTEAALKNVLETAVELLQDAEDAVTDGMVVLNNSVYMRLRAAVKEATGVVHGIAVSIESWTRKRMRTTKTRRDKTTADN